MAKIARFITALLICFSSLFFAQPVRPDRGLPPVALVSHESGRWVIAGKKNMVTLNQADLAISVKAGDTTWRLRPSGNKDALVKSGGSEFFLRLADAGAITVEPYAPGYKAGVKLTLTDWPDGGRSSGRAKLDLVLFLTICLEGKDEELVFDVAAKEGRTVLRQLDWPTALDGAEIDYSVLSNGRGTLLPRTWPKEYSPIRTITKEGKIAASDMSEVQSNLIESWSMSWWGFQKGKSAMMIIVETPDDAAYQFTHPAGGPTVIGPRWRASLGRFGYPRALRMSFIPDGNYVEMAKWYRRHVIDRGQFISLNEKIARTPAVAQLIGTPLTRLSILRNVKPGSFRYDPKVPAKNYSLTTFDQRAAQLRALKANGTDRLVLCLTGWPRLGYDRQHPDELPPSAEAGGWDGMKRLYQACRDLGYFFTLNDQYRDYYLDAPSYDPQFAIHEENAATPPQAFPGTRFGQRKEGVIPIMDHWDGGAQTYLNPRLMLGYLIQTYHTLFEHGIHPHGIYLDVFGYVPPDEDFNPEHPVTRAESMRARADCYNWSRANLGIVGTEAAADWVIPYADLASPLGAAKAVTVPLFNLVYHDAMVIPYRAGDLYGLLNGGAPQLSIDEIEKNKDWLRRISALHRRVALLEMIKHEFLDTSYRKERTTFADGTTVTVDWTANTVTVDPE